MLILDTHVWLWWIDQNARLPSWLAAQIADPVTLIALSAVSVIIATALTHQAQLASLDDKFPLYAELAEALIRRDKAL